MMTIRKFTLCALLTAVMYPGLAAGIQMKHPNNERGYVQDTMHVFDKPDSVNLFNGAMAITVPLGRRYPLSETFSYGLSLTYSSQVWDNIFVFEDLGDPPPPDVDPWATVGFPSRLCNVGLGWSLSFGMLFPPGTPNFNPYLNWLFVAQDGSQHHFYRTLHHGDYDGTEPQEEDDVYYTRDGSYLRMVIVDETTIIIEEPGGIEYVLAPIDGTGFEDWRTVQIRDRFSDEVDTNYLNISYNYVDPVCEAVTTEPCERWELEDSLERTHVLEFARVESQLGSGDVSHSTYLRSASLEGFKGLSHSQYVFSYSTEDIIRSNNHNHPTLPHEVSVRLLGSIDLPDAADVGGEWVNSSFQFAYNLDRCWSTPDYPCESGSLARLSQPTGGVNSWDYGRYYFPGGNKLCGGALPINDLWYWEQYHLSLVSNIGVLRRAVRNPGNNSGGLVWSYEPESGVDEWTPAVSRTVTDPDGNDTIHYFQTGAIRCHQDPQNPGQWIGWDYALPFSEDEVGGLSLSREYFQGDSVTGEVKKRDYVAYVHDELPPLDGGSTSGEDEMIRRQPRWWYDTDRRSAKTLTHYLTGGLLSQTVVTENSNFDGLSHYRTTDTVADLGVGYCRPSESTDCITGKTSTTTFNLQSGLYEFDPDENTADPSHSYVEWDVYDPWILGTSVFSQTMITRGNGNDPPDTVTTETVFDPSTGRRRRVRTYANGVSQGEHDLITTYGYDVFGNRTLTARYGADRQLLPLGNLADLSLPIPDSATATEFDYGVAARAYPLAIGDPQAPEPPLTLDRDIDQWTGLTLSERDISGFETTFDYDAMGRVTTVTPEDVRAASFELVYDPVVLSGDLTLDDDPSIDTFAKTTMKAVDRQGGGVLSKSWVKFDGFGRTYRRQVRMPDDQGEDRWAKKISVSDGRGRLVKSSEWHPHDLADTSSVWTVHSDHDFEGRIGQIIRPDGATTTFAYDGIRQSERTLHDVPVDDNPTPVDITVTTKNDAFGHVRKLVEPVDNATSVTTTSVFDVLGNLTKVRIKPSDSPANQVRIFEYDHLGFLRKETLPEKTYNQPWDVQWSHFNTRGQAGLVDDAGRYFLNVHDAFDRLIEVWERQGPAQNAQRRLLKEFDYYDSDDGVQHGYDSTYGWALHKLQHASNWTYYDPGNWDAMIYIGSGYTYKGAGGATDNRMTEGGSDNVAERFESVTEYSPLGMVKNVTYPAVTFPGTQDWQGNIPPARVVEYDYEYGWLIGVREGASYLASGFDYYPSGLIHEFMHGNGVVERTTIDELTYLPRPLTIQTLGATVDWSTDYTYDTAGNIATWDTTDNAYDRIGRLVESVTPGERSEYLSYDGFGNLTQRHELGGGYDDVYGFTMDQATNRITNGGIQYDNAGNLTDFGTEADITLTYTALNQAVFIDSTAIQYNFFDANGKRAVEAGPVYTYILRDHDGEPLRRIGLTDIDGDQDLEWTWERDYIRMPGHLLSAIVHDPDGTGGRATESSRFFHVDHLGTPRLITGAGGSNKARHDYLPFGTQTSNTDQDGDNPNEALKFTGKKRDFFSAPATKYDLDDFHARMYSPYLGRFLNPDPVSGVGGGSQRTNGYSYVLNNPLTYVDPDGKDPLTATLVMNQMNTQMALSSAAVAGSNADVSGLAAWVGNRISDAKFLVATLVVADQMIRNTVFSKGKGVTPERNKAKDDAGRARDERKAQGQKAKERKRFAPRETTPRDRNAESIPTGAPSPNTDVDGNTESPSEQDIQNAFPTVSFN